MTRLGTVLAAMALLAAAPAPAVQPDEVLDDPGLEARARDLSAGLRCLVCRNESIDESNAGLARDLRLLVRERLTEGDSDQEVLDFIVARYGDYVLLRPRLAGSNLVLWLTAPVLLLAGAGVAVIYLRGRARGQTPARLSEAEEKKLAALLEREGDA